MLQSVVDVFLSHVERRGDQVAYRFSDGQQIVASFSFGEIDRAARGVAGCLQEHCEAGDRILLLMETEADFVRAFFGCLYAGAIAVPLNLPVGERGVAKIREIAADASARVLLGSEGALRMLGEHGLDVQGMEISTMLERSASFRPVNLRPEHVAFLQYTSGSTGAPKGVVVTHRNLLANEEMIRRSCRHDEGSVFVGWLPLFHDMGLVGNILQPAYVGIPSILMPPAAFIRRPRRWLQLISDYQATTSGGPNFAYETCVRRIDDAEVEGLDLSSWRIAFNGAEPIRFRTLERFAAKFSRAGFSQRAFYPVYGLAEATLMVTANDFGEAPQVRHVPAKALQQGMVPKGDVGEQQAQGETRAILSCGRPRPGQVVRIVHPERCETLGEREVGEIWVAGDNVAQGYWNQPGLSEATFRARTSDGAGPFLRTGDLGFLEGGLLHVTGRRKDVLVINGRNHYPQDLEHTVRDSDEAFAGRSAAAVTVADGDGEALVVMQEVSRSLLSRRAAETQPGRLGELRDGIRRALATEHGLFAQHVLLVPQGSLPLTTSGKIQRARCRELLESGRFAEFSAQAAVRAASGS